MNGPLLSVDDLAAWLHTSRAAIYKRVERQQLPGVVRISRRIYFRRSVIEAFVRSHEAKN